MDMTGINRVAQRLGPRLRARHALLLRVPEHGRPWVHLGHQGHKWKGYRTRDHQRRGGQHVSRWDHLFINVDVWLQVTSVVRPVHHRLYELVDRFVTQSDTRSKEIKKN
jgi:hypothetical protein